MATKPIAPIPEPPKGSDPALRSFLTAMKEAVEVRLGRRGDPLEQAVTKRELIDGGVARLASGVRSDLAPVVVEASEARITPPVPIGFSAEGTFGGITLTWENPFAAYGVHGYTEIWRGPSNDTAERILINSSRGTVFFDRIADTGAGDYWYWIRYVSEYDRAGPFSQPIQASKQADVAAIMAEISGRIEQSDLSAALSGELDELKNSWTVRIDVNGYVAGVGLYNSGTSADFAVLADRFWVGSPQVGKVKPFIIENGTVYMDAAVIRDGTIQQGKLGPISFGKLVDSNGNAVTTLTGVLRADMIDVGSLQVTDANISGVLRSGAVASNGQPLWMLDKNGGMTLNGSGAGGRMEVRENVIKVFDANGTLRVQLGDLSL